MRKLVLGAIVALFVLLMAYVVLAAKPEAKDPGKNEDGLACHSKTGRCYILLKGPPLEDKDYKIKKQESCIKDAITDPDEGKGN